MKELTLQEFKEKKTELEQGIRTLLNNFTKETDVMVSDINFNRTSINGMGYSTSINGMGYSFSEVFYELNVKTEL